MLQNAQDTLAVVLNCQGHTVYDCYVPPHEDRLLFPMEVVLTDRNRCNIFPKKCTIEVTGLGGGDLPFPDRADVVVRTDRHGQNVYGPSLSTVEQDSSCHYLGVQLIVVRIGLQLLVGEVEEQLEIELALVLVLDDCKEYILNTFQKLDHSSISHNFLPLLEDHSKEVLADSKYHQHQTSFLENSTNLQAVYLLTKLGSKAQAKLEMK